MQWFNRKQKNDLLARHLSTVVLMVVMLPLTVYAADIGKTDSTSGVLHVYGALTESACRLEMNSDRQDILLGETGTGRLQQPGDQGDPVMFELWLRDCLRAQSGSRDERTGNLVRSRDQSVVSVSFSAPSDMDNPQLVKASGISGLALRLTDSQGRDVRLGSRGEPLILAPGQNTLTYTIIPERTRAPLMAGAYRAIVDFRLDYD